MYSRKDVTRSTLTAAVLLTLGAGSAYGSVSDTGILSNNFTMISNAGGLQGGNNDTKFIWDGTVKTSVVTDGSSNASISSVSKFSGFLWVAKYINIYGPGTYVFDTTCPPGNPSCGTGTTAQQLTLTVPAGYLGAHMLFDWGAPNTSTACGVANCDIDVIQLYKINDSWAATGKNTDSDPVGSATSLDPFCGELGAGLQPNSCQSANNNGNTRNTVWSLVSVDTPNSTIGSGALADETNIAHGTKMIDGPFVGSQANFNVMVDTAPDQFTLTDQSNVAANTPIESAPISLTKAGATGTPVFTISVSGAAGSAYSIGTGGVYAAYTSSPGTITASQTVKVRHTSAAAACGTADTTLTIGGTSDTFSTTVTGAACSDTRPDGFTFGNPTTGVALSSTVTSSPITVNGITAAVPVDIFVTGDPSSQYSVNGGAYTSAAGTVVLNDTVTVRHTSAATNNTDTSTTLTIGGVSSPANQVSGTFTSTTVSAASTAPTIAQDPSGAKACSISTKPVSAIERADWWLVAGFLAWLGLVVRRRRQNQA